jgi:hypothetical protein
MNRSLYCRLLLCPAILLGLMACGGPTKSQVPLAGGNTGCIRGTVYYKYMSPQETAPQRYAKVKVAAWFESSEKPIGETETDASGTYCIQVPLGVKVDLRVWGMRSQNTGGESYQCEGSADGIETGTSPKKCGEDCIQADITAACRKFVPSRRRF